MKIFVGIVIILSFSQICTSQDIEALKANTAYLASDELGGRGPGSEGIRKAAEHIAEQFRKVGLKPFNADGYFQTFEIPGQKQPESNVIGYLPAGKKTSRSVVFTAHYDGYGIREVEGTDDKIHNAAIDNAAGAAALIEMARIFAGRERPSQNLVFIATAAEELGARDTDSKLTGAEYYAENPLFELSGISIVLNIDGINASGPAADFFVMPRQGIDFLGEILEAAKPFPIKYDPPDWIDGMNKGFDTAAFLSRGIPAVTIWSGFRRRPEAKGPVPRFGRVHSPDDELNETWNWDGTAEYLRLYEAIADHFLKNVKKAGVSDRDLFKRDEN